MSVKCPYCRFDGEPSVMKKLSPQAWTFLIVLLIFFFPLFWLPLVLEGFKERIWECRACGKRLGTA